MKHPLKDTPTEDMYNSLSQAYPPHKTNEPPIQSSLPPAGIPPPMIQTLQTPSGRQDHRLQHVLKCVEQ